MARLLSALTALIGVFLTGLLGFVAVNRRRRSQVVRADGEAMSNAEQLAEQIGAGPC